MDDTNANLTLFEKRVNERCRNAWRWRR